MNFLQRLVEILEFILRLTDILLKPGEELFPEFLLSSTSCPIDLIFILKKLRVFQLVIFRKEIRITGKRFRSAEIVLRLIDPHEPYHLLLRLLPDRLIGFAVLLIIGLELA